LRLIAGYGGGEKRDDHQGNNERSAGTHECEIQEGRRAKLHAALIATFG
jgi:hypothetical protein